MEFCPLLPASPAIHPMIHTLVQMIHIQTASACAHSTERPYLQGLDAEHFTHILMHTHTLIYTHSLIHIYTHTYTLTLTHTFSHIYSHTLTLSYIYTLIHTLSHIYTQVSTQFNVLRVSKDRRKSVCLL